MQEGSSSSLLDEFSGKRRFPLSALLESGNHSGGVCHLHMLPSCFRCIHDRTTSLWKNDSLNYYGVLSQWS